MPVRVAIQGAGSLIGQGIIKALKMASLESTLIALDAFPTAVGLYWADSAHVVPDVLAPNVSEAEYVEYLVELLNRERADVLLVATDFEVPMFARRRGEIETRCKCKVVVSSPEVAEIADDKWLTYQFLKAHDLPCPPSLIDIHRIDAFVAQVGFPLIVKPRRGARSRQVSLVRERTGLSSALMHAGSDPIVQAAIGTPDSEYTCGAVVFDGECLGVIVMRRDLRDGNTFRSYLRPEPELEALIRRAALALNPYGPANFQLRLGPAGPAIFEINARFSGTTIIRALAGFNEVEAVIRAVAFDERMMLQQSKYGVVLRYWEEQFVSWDDFERIGRAVLQ